MLTVWVIETYVEVISKNICIFFQNLSWHTRALACFWRIKNSLSTCAKEKKGWSFPLHDFPVASMMGWFLYYTIHLMIECAVLSDSRSLMEYWWIVRLLTIFEKMFKTVMISLLSTNVIFSEDTILSDKNGFIVFQNIFLWVTFFSKCFRSFSTWLYFVFLILSYFTFRVILLKRLDRRKRSSPWIFMFHISEYSEQISMLVLQSF